MELEKSVISPDWEEHPDEVATNFDFTHDKKVVEWLKARPNQGVASYSGWNFHARVWWTGEVFGCEVWQYHNPVGVLYEPTIEEIMETVSSGYGYD